MAEGHKKANLPGMTALKSDNGPDLSPSYRAFSWTDGGTTVPVREQDDQCQHECGVTMQEDIVSFAILKYSE